MSYVRGVYGSELRAVVGYCESDNRPSISIKGEGSLTSCGIVILSKKLLHVAMYKRQSHAVVNILSLNKKFFIFMWGYQVSETESRVS